MIAGVFVTTSTASASAQNVDRECRQVLQVWAANALSASSPSATALRMSECNSAASRSSVSGSWRCANQKRLERVCSRPSLPRGTGCERSTCPPAVSALIASERAMGVDLPRDHGWVFTTTRHGELMEKATRVQGRNGRTLNVTVDPTEGEICRSHAGAHICPVLMALTEIP